MDESCNHQKLWMNPVTIKSYDESCNPQKLWVNPVTINFYG